LAANTRALNHRTIQAIDLFEWRPWMDESARKASLPRYLPGQSFYEDVKQLLRPFGLLVSVEKRDLLEYVPPPEPIELLFIDAMKSWDLAQKIISSFFPLLIAGKSCVVQQDFAWYNSVIATNHLLMWRLRDHFQWMHHVPNSCSVAFLCTKGFTASEMPSLSPDSFTVEMVEEAYDYCRNCVSSDMQIVLEIAKLGFLLSQGHVRAAHQQMERLAASTRGLPEHMLEEVRRAVRGCPAAKAESAGDPVVTWLAEIEAWASTKPAPRRRGFFRSWRAKESTCAAPSPAALPDPKAR